MHNKTENWFLWKYSSGLLSFIKKMSTFPLINSDIKKNLFRSEVIFRCQKITFLGYSKRCFLSKEKVPWSLPLLTSFFISFEFWLTIRNTIFRHICWCCRYKLSKVKLIHKCRKIVSHHMLLFSVRL